MNTFDPYVLPPPLKLSSSESLVASPEELSDSSADSSSFPLKEDVLEFLS